MFQPISPHTCSSLIAANPYQINELQIGMRLQVPLLCACPTRKQTATGTKYLLTYTIHNGQHIPAIANRFNVSTNSILDANNLEENTILISTTRILIPLATQPFSLQTITCENHQFLTLPLSSSSYPAKGESNEGIGIAAAGFCLLVLILLVIQKGKRWSFPRWK